MDEILLASIIADLTTDGHLQIKSSGVASFYSKDISEINSFNEKFNILFNKKGNIYEDNRNGNLRYKLFICDTKACRFLKEKGAPVGNKTNNSFFVPEWIYKGSKEVRREYLRRLFDAEGSICYNRGRITFTMHKNELLIEDVKCYFFQIKNLLSLFNILSSNIWISNGAKRKDGSKSKMLRIAINKSQIKNYQSNIGFSNLAKLRKLNKVVEYI